MKIKKHFEINKDRFIENKVPKWFINWYKIMLSLQNEIFHQIKWILESWDFLWAKIFYEEITKYNPNKKWH